MLFSDVCLIFCVFVNNFLVVVGCRCKGASWLRKGNRNVPFDPLPFEQDSKEICREIARGAKIKLPKLKG